MISTNECIVFYISLDISALSVSEAADQGSRHVNQRPLLNGNDFNGNNRIKQQ